MKSNLRNPRLINNELQHCFRFYSNYPIPNFLLPDFIKELNKELMPITITERQDYSKSKRDENYQDRSKKFLNLFGLIKLFQNRNWVLGGF